MHDSGENVSSAPASPAPKDTNLNSSAADIEEPGSAVKNKKKIQNLQAQMTSMIGGGDNLQSHQPSI